MKLPSSEAISDVVSYIGVGLMALGVGTVYSWPGAVAVFALGLPIVEIQRHMRWQREMNMVLLQALRGINAAFSAQVQSEKVTLEMVSSVHALLRRLADEGITRE